MTVSLVKFDGSLGSLRRAIELCGGFEKLDRNDKVLIKPNNSFRHKLVPPYGVVTTSKILDGLIQLLLEHGYKDISIGEGNIADVIGSDTRRGYRWAGIDRVAKRYGVKLIDFNQGPFQELDLGGVKVQVSKTALEADFLINVPVLKTHSQTKVSLGFKNLKGCLSIASRKRFHTTNRLDTLICLLNEAIRSRLVIIDGIYMLEKGPDNLLGVAHRKDLIIASPDVFACDVVGATILGIDPLQVGYLREFAERHNRSLDISAIQTEGEDIEALKENLEWKPDIIKELFAPAKISGLSLPYPGGTLCSGCYVILSFALLAFSKGNPKRDFDNAELYCGQLYCEKEVKSTRPAQKILLYGDCAIRNNKNLQDASKIEGCPPTFRNTLFVLMKTLLTKPTMLRMILLMTMKLIGIRLGIYREVFSKWERYRSKEFDKTLF